MEKQITLSIPKACSEKWSSFTSTNDGRRCATCNKVVVDFVNKSDDEIVDYFTHKNEKVCGRIRTSQAKTSSNNVVLPLINPGWRLLTASTLMLLAILLGTPSFGNSFTLKPDTEMVQLPVGQSRDASIVNPDYTIKGIVKEADGISPLAGVNIYLKGTTVGTVSDANGQFEFPQKLKVGDILVFSFIGLERLEYVVPNDVKEMIEISMVLDEAIMMGELVAYEVYVKQPTTIARWWGKIKGVF